LFRVEVSAMAWLVIENRPNARNAMEMEMSAV